MTIFNLHVIISNKCLIKIKKNRKKRLKKEKTIDNYLTIII